MAFSLRGAPPSPSPSEGDAPRGRHFRMVRFLSDRRRKRNGTKPTVFYKKKTFANRIRESNLREKIAKTFKILKFLQKFTIFHFFGFFDEKLKNADLKK